MKVTIKLYGVFRIDRFKEEQQSYPEGSSVKDIVGRLQLSEDLLGIVLVNGVHSDTKHLLTDGDILSLLPVLDGG